MAQTNTRRAREDREEDVPENPLTAAEMKRGRTYRVTGLGRGRGFRGKMVGMGIRPGIPLSLIGGWGRGPRLLQAGRNQVMAGREMLAHVYVEECSENKGGTEGEEDH